MGIFARLARLIKSNLNDLISRAEDPEKMLNQIVIDTNAQLVEAKKQVAASIADEKRREIDVSSAPGKGNLENPELVDFRRRFWWRYPTKRGLVSHLCVPWVW